MIKSYYEPITDQPCFAWLSIAGHQRVAQIVVKMESADGHKNEYELKYDRQLKQQARQYAGADAMYELLATMATKLNKSSELRKEIEELLVEIDNIEVPV